MKRPIILLASLAAAVAAGCANYQGAAIGTPAAQVRATYGAPTLVTPLADGESWAYSGAPEGRHVQIMRFDASGKLVSNVQGLTPARIAEVAVGQTQSQVEALIGPSYWSLRYPFRQDELVHVYRLLDGSLPTCFYVGYDASGHVSSTGMRDEDRPERGMLSSRPC